MTPPFTTAATLAGIPHGFFGRRGGVSRGDLASLNCGLGSNDDPALIVENRRLAAEACIGHVAGDEGRRRRMGEFQLCLMQGGRIHAV